MKQLFFLFLIFTASASGQIASTESATPIPTERTYRTTEVDFKPQLKDGMYTLSLFISQNFNFPPAIKNKKITIFSSFIIEPDGSMTNIKAFYVSLKDYIDSNVQKITTEDEKINELDQIETMKAETVRVLTLFKKIWSPAIKDGKTVRCLYNYPIGFNIE